MATRAQKIRLAVFFLVANAVLAGFLLIVTGAELFEERDRYRISFEGISVGGLNVGAAVKYQGITVGRVEDSYISPRDISAVMVEISVEPEKARNAIRTDTKAAIYNLGITGLKYIELIPGSSTSPVLPPGSQLQAGETFLADIDRQAEILTNKVEVLLDRVNLLLDDRNRGHIQQALAATSGAAAQVDTLVRANRQRMDSVLVDLAATSRAVAHTAATLQATVEEMHGMLANPRMRTAVADAQVAMRQLRRTMEGPLPELLTSAARLTENADQAVLHVDQTVLQTRASLVGALQEMEEAMQNLRELSELVRDNPAVLIRGQRVEP
ncbi:MAG: MlaD family protein [Candidatus Latescibacterota bacterium]